MLKSNWEQREHSDKRSIQAERHKGITQSDILIKGMMQRFKATELLITALRMKALDIYDWGTV